MIFILYYTTDCHAFPHGYKRKTENIHALVRHEMTAWEYPGEEGEPVSIPSFTPIIVTEEGGSWYEIEYTTKKSSGVVWITREDFFWGCLRYDGRPKQIIADGTYHLKKKYSDSFRNVPLSYPGKDLSCTFRFLSDNRFLIGLSSADRYLSAPDPKDDQIKWRSENQAGVFHIIKKHKGYLIMEENSRKYLSCDGSIYQFADQGTVFSLTREGKAVTDDSLRDFVQFDGEWAKRHYGSGKKRDSEHGNFCTSGCGILAVVNAVYSTTGHYISPFVLADYAVKKYYRIEGSGTDSGFFKAAAVKFGGSYGFTYRGTGESLEQLKDRLLAGQTAITYIPGHYVTIVDYNPDTKRFLLLDPHYLPRRKTCAFGDWVSQKTLESGDLFAQTFYYYKACD